MPEMKQKELLKTDGEYIYIKKLIKKEKKNEGTLCPHVSWTYMFNNFVSIA